MACLRPDVLLNIVLTKWDKNQLEQVCGPSWCLLKAISLLTSTTTTTPPLATPSSSNSTGSQYGSVLLDCALGTAHWSPEAPRRAITPDSSHARVLRFPGRARHCKLGVVAPLAHEHTSTIRIFGCHFDLPSQSTMNTSHGLD